MPDRRAGTTLRGRRLSRRMLRLITTRYTNRPILLSELDWPLEGPAKVFLEPQPGTSPAGPSSGPLLLGACGDGCARKGPLDKPVAA